MAWVIEARSAIARPASHKFLGVAGTDLRWVPDVADALHFCREQDAANVVAVFRLAEVEHAVPVEHGNLSGELGERVKPAVC